MNIQLSKISVAISLLFLIFLSSCREEEKQVLSPPVIAGLEVGLGNSHTSYVGSDIHIEAEIEAQGKIKEVTIEVFKKEGSGWTAQKEYTEFSGQLNTNFHKHIDVDRSAAPGSYILRMTVSDLLGKTTTVDENLELIILNDNVSPIINVTTFPVANKIFLNGETITISGTVSDNIALANVLVVLAREEDQIAESDLSESNAKLITVADIRDFSSLEFQNFSASIVVGASTDNGFQPKPIQGENAWKSGSYYLVVKTKDASQNNTFSAHYPIKINL